MNTTVFYAVVIAAAAFVINLISFFAGLQTDHIKHFQAVQWVTLAVIFVGLYLGADTKRKELPGARMTFGQAFGAVFLIGLLYTVLSVIGGYIHTQFIHPDFAQYMLANIREQISSQGVPEAQLEGIMGFQAKMFSPTGMIITGLIFGTIFSAILSLFHALALTRRRTMFKLLLIYGIVFGSIGLVFGGLGGLPKGAFLLGAVKQFAINVVVAVGGWGLLLKLTGYAADAPPPAPADAL